MNIIKISKNVIKINNKIYKKYNLFIKNDNERFQNEHKILRMLNIMFQIRIITGILEFLFGQ